jgi:hypothetical protein
LVRLGQVRAEPTRRWGLHAGDVMRVNDAHCSTAVTPSSTPCATSRPSGAVLRDFRRPTVPRNGARRWWPGRGCQHPFTSPPMYGTIPARTTPGCTDGCRPRPAGRRESDRVPTLPLRAGPDLRASSPSARASRRAAVRPSSQRAAHRRRRMSGPRRVRRPRSREAPARTTCMAAADSTCRSRPGRPGDALDAHGQTG